MPKVTYQQLMSPKVLAKMIPHLEDGPYIKFEPKSSLTIFDYARRHRELLLHGKVQDERPTNSQTESTDMGKQSS